MQVYWPNLKFHDQDWLKTAAYALIRPPLSAGIRRPSPLWGFPLSFIAALSLLISSMFPLWMRLNTCLLNDDKWTELGSVLCSADKPPLDPKILLLRTDVGIQNILAFTSFFFFPHWRLLSLRIIHVLAFFLPSAPCWCSRTLGDFNILKLGFVVSYLLELRETQATPWATWWS